MVSGSCACTSMHEAEVGGQVAADLVPRVAGVVAAHHVPVLLHEQHVRARRVHRDAVDAVADLGIRVGNVLRCSPRLIGCQVSPRVVGAEGAGGRDGDVDPRRVARIEQDRVQAHAARARLPAGPEPWPRSPESSCQVCAAVGRAEQGGVFHSGVDGVRIGQRRLEMPDALELPGVRRAVVPLVRAGHAVVDELVAHRLPGLAAVVGALDQSARTSRWTATHTADSGPPASPSGGKSPSPQSAGR